jgi:hypothetical protein
MNALRSVTSFASITTSDNGRDKHSKGRSFTSFTVPQHLHIRRHAATAVDLRASREDAPVIARSPQALKGAVVECDSERAGIGVTALLKRRLRPGRRERCDVPFGVCHRFVVEVVGPPRRTA